MKLWFLIPYCLEYEGFYDTLGFHDKEAALLTTRAIKPL